MPAFDFVLARRYRLTAPLGDGGMASVYRARDLRLNREVAVKVLREDLTSDPDFLQRFQREAQFVASLSHPNIVPVYDVGEDRGTHFIVMEYIRGRTVRDLLETTGPLTVDQALDIMRNVLAALEYAHGKGIVHRDVKPHNILLPVGGSARLADFGIAHLADSASTRTAAILGSIHYLSPEQARGDEATPRSDLYACGIVLFELTTGAPPFDGVNALAIAHHHLETPPPLERLHPSLRPLVACALEKDPDDRYPDAQAFLAALDSVDPHDRTLVLAPVTDQTQPLPLIPRDEPVERHDFVPDGVELRRSARKTGIVAFIGCLLLAAAAYLAPSTVDGYSLPAYPSAPYAALPGAFLLAVIASWLHIRSWRYQMDGNAAVLQWGLLSHRRFGVPIRYITTLELKQSMIDRVLGLGTVELSARDQHGKERRLVLQDLPHPRESYDELLHFLGRTVRGRPVAELVEENQVPL